jgi:hypothetical protein
MSLCEAFLAQLVGEWRGAGSVFYPTMPSTVFFDAGASFALPPGPTVKRFVATKSWSVNAKGVGMHFDAGFLRCSEDGRVLDWQLAHNSGNTESLRGPVADDGKSVTLSSVGISGAPDTLATRRVISIDAATNTLQQSFAMATLSVPDVTSHLQISLSKSFNA